MKEKVQLVRSSSLIAELHLQASLLDMQDPQGMVGRLVEKRVGKPLPQIRRSGGLLPESLKKIEGQVAIITPLEPLSASQDHILNLVRIAAKRCAGVWISSPDFFLSPEKGPVFDCL